MDANQRLEEVAVCQFLRLRAEPPDCQCIIKGAADFADVIGAYPNQNTIEISRLRHARSPNHRPVEAVAMGQSRCRVDETHCREHDDESKA
jgi:hypothetical protein